MKDFINKTICYTSAFVLLFSISAIDCGYQYVCMGLVSLGVLMLYGVANGWIE